MAFTSSSNSDEKEFQEKLSEFSAHAREREAADLAERLNLNYVNLTAVSPQVQALALISEEEARKSFCAPFLLKGKELNIACLNPEFPSFKEVLKKINDSGYKTKIFIVSLASLEAIWKNFELVSFSQKNITGSVELDSANLDEIKKAVSDLQKIKTAIAEFKSPYTSRIFEIILAGALAIDSSDIHIEAEENNGRVRYRLDGELVDISSLTPNQYRSVVSRIKLMSGMKINVKNSAQDGRFTMKTGETDIEVRVSCVPSAYGETVVLRLLDPKNIKLNLEDLGFRSDDLEVIKNYINKPNGIILNTGPTGSGKTTTLYAFLRRIYKPEIKIITVEDPIEYHLEGITQTQVNAEKNYTFANGLRSILRQDPDAILVGEIRDEETAGIAMNAALTGHLVFSTLHTNEATGAIPRLIDMKVQPSILGSALSLVIAQRLTRKLCKNCKIQKEISGEFLNQIKKILSEMPSRVGKPELGEKVFVFEAKSGGCEFCNHTGYKGRVAIIELFEIDSEIQELIIQPILPTIGKMREVAQKKGMVSMNQDAVLKILAGITDFAEAESVLGKIF